MINPISIGFASAQTSASTSDFPDGLNSELKELNSENWTFYLDEENKVYYIDFEMFNVNLNDIQIKDESGEVVMKDNLWDLPVNTIYELDLKKFKPGRYDVELRTYTGIIRKNVVVSE